MIYFFSSRRRHTRLQGDWSSDVCSSDLVHHHQRQRLAQALQAHELALQLGTEETPVGHARQPVAVRQQLQHLALLRNLQMRAHACLENGRSEEHTSELQSPCNLVCRLLLEKKKPQYYHNTNV